MEVLIGLAIFAGVWWALARFWRGKGYGVLIRHLGGFAGGFITLTLLLAIFSPDIEGQAAAMETAEDIHTKENELIADAPAELMPAVAKQEKKGSTATLGMTPEQYVERFNQLVGPFEKSSGLNLKILPKTLQIIDSPSGRGFNSEITENALIGGIVDKTNGKIISVTYVGMGDGSEKSGAEVMLIASAVFAVSLPDGSMEIGGNNVMALINEADKKGGAEVSRVSNKVKLTYKDSELGHLFTARAL